MINIIVAYSKLNRIIGKDGKIPWTLPEDMKHFKETTDGHVVIMGHNTWNSLPQKLKPLSNRINIVLSRKYGVVREQRNLWFINKFERALEFCNRAFSDKCVFVIGGQSVYQHALEMNVVHKIIATEVHEMYEGDTYFPPLNTDWKRKVIRETEKFDVVTYQKV